MKTYRKFAFFDVDGTIINFKTMMDFEEFWLSYQSNKKQTDGKCNLLQKRKHFIHKMIPKLPRKQANILYYRGYKGRSEKEVSKLIQCWFKELKKSKKDYYKKEVISKLTMLQKNNVEPVFVSGSSIELISNFANELNVKYLIATNLKAENGFYTGEIIGNPLIGEGKRNAIESFLQHFEVSPQDCYAFGDHVSDAHMLKYVGTSFIVKGDSKLEEIAKEHSWTILKNNTYYE